MHGAPSRCDEVRDGRTRHRPKKNRRVIIFAHTIGYVADEISAHAETQGWAWRIADGHGLDVCAA